MKTTNCWIVLSLCGAGLILTGAMAPSASAYPQYGPQYGYGQGQGYYREHPDLRQLIDQTQNDLRAAAQFERGNGKEQERYRNAQKSLSTLDRHLTKGKYHKDDMDKAIEDIQNVLDHNTLQGTSRDALLSDVQRLREARAAYH